MLGVESDSDKGTTSMYNKAIHNNSSSLVGRSKIQSGDGDVEMQELGEVVNVNENFNHYNFNNQNNTPSNYYGKNNQQ